MNGIVAPTHTALDNIPLSRRLREIMEDKGKRYSISAMSARIGINRETLRLMLSGKREIYNYELEWIVKDLKLSVDRVLQEDCKSEGVLLIDLLDREEQTKSLILAERLLNNALGLTERCMALHRLARAHFFNHNFYEAYRSITDAHKLALILSEEYQDESTICNVLSYMVEVYTAKQDYTNAVKALEKVETSFQNRPNKLAFLFFLHAKMKEMLGDIESARMFAYQSFEQAKLTQKMLLIGKTAVNAAHFEYLSKNYVVSKDLLVEAIGLLSDDIYSLMIARKEFIKCLLMLGDIDRAVAEITKALSEVEGQPKMKKIEGKLLLLMAKATNEPEYAERVAEYEAYGSEIRVIACKFLKDYFGNKGDSHGYRRYYGIEGQLDPCGADILREGAL